MEATHVIGVDLARVFLKDTGKDQVSTLLWGDPVEVTAVTDEHVELLLPELRPGLARQPGFIKPTKASKLRPADCVVPIGEHKVLKVDFVDVQQGDGCTLETPRGKVVLIDGGDNKLFARHLAGRFRGTTAARPLPVEAILITHGDADHFLGLNEILASETHDTPEKRIFIQPRRVFHNGLVKRPSAVAETASLGATALVDGERIITGLESDLLAVADNQMNEPFQRWKRTLATWAQRKPIQFRRLALGDDGDEVFGFLAEEQIHVQILGPIPRQGGLPFLRTPKKGPRVGHESLAVDADEGGSYSSSHTINGHSVVFRLAYGDVRVLFTGDLNDEAGRTLTRAHNRGEVDLRAEVLKVPHHGSADFSGALLKAIAPVVSVVSSGDESARKEYIHPRATLMGALGRWSRVDEPLIFCTELVAFFEVVGQVTPTGPDAHPFFAFQRTEFGLVKVRTDGTRLVVCTNSGQTTMKECYAYRFDEMGEPQPDGVTQA